MELINIGSINSSLFLSLRSGLNLISGVNGVFATYPNPAAKDFPGLPIIIVKTSANMRNPTYENRVLADFNGLITVHSNSQQTLNQINDACYTKIKEMISGNEININNPTYRVGVGNTSFIGDKAYHQKDLEVTGWVME